MSKKNSGETIKRIVCKLLGRNNLVVLELVNNKNSEFTSRKILIGVISIATGSFSKRFPPLLACHDLPN